MMKRYGYPWEAVSETGYSGLYVKADDLRNFLEKFIADFDGDLTPLRELMEGLR